mmetsp:Transcript_93544/g.209424  ORF Transcript_93544/g.209424 Transcript_93544/m.209424 type:complete len:1284 (-) Transcript_93544:148-3999(-)
MAQSIKVAVRVRPLNQRELQLDSPVVVSMQDQTATVHCSEKGPKHFTYDYVYDSIDPSGNRFASQSEIFDDIGTAMLSKAIDGFNGTLFAYGQTGSGKSFTMMGPAEDKGVIPRMIQSLFERKRDIEHDAHKELQVWVSYLEIYKERLVDLFDCENKQADVKIMEHPKLGVYVRGAQEVPCETEEEVLSNLDYGLKRRSIAATNMNQSSSRSHAVFCIRTTTLEGLRPSLRFPKGRDKGKDDRKALHAKLNLIDLAGSERSNKAGTRDERLKEGSAINQSLSQLGIVIKTLAEKKDKAPFRASKLTFLLKDSLAGNCATYLMAAVSPASDNMDETLSTLRFASSVKTIQTIPVQNKDKKDQLIDALQEEMKLLKAQLAAGGINSDEAMEQLRERERLIKEKLQMDFKEDLKVARELQKAKESALESNGLSQQNITQAFGISNGMPYMVNMSFDPMLAGCLIYLIKETEPTTIGAHKDNTIVLNGLGVPDFLCRIEYKANVGTSILRLGDAGRVGVNGKMLKPDEYMSISHGDKVFLGRASVLKLIDPSAGGGEAGTLEKNDLLLEVEGDAQAAAQLENSQSWASLEMYIDQVIRQMPKSSASKFLGELKMACRMSDEANELTAEMRSEESLHLEVDITSSVPPCVVVRVLHLPPGRDCQDESAWVTKYLWSASQLAERLERMRDYAGAIKLHGQAEVDPLEDPWHEAEPIEISQRLRHLGNMAEEAYTFMQHQLANSGNMAFQTRGSILQMFFGFWKASVSALKQERKATNQKNGTGRLGLVKSNSPNGRMRSTIVPQKEQAMTRKKTLRPPPEAPMKRKPSMKQQKVQIMDTAVEVSHDKVEEVVPTKSEVGRTKSDAGPTKSEVPPKPVATYEAPEATPEVVVGSSYSAGPGPDSSEEVIALRSELAATTRTARMAEFKATQLSEENEALQKQLAAKQEDIEKLSNQLEVAWQLSSVLRDRLIARKEKAEEAGPVATAMAEAMGEPELPDVLATAEALAATVRSVTAAARQAQEMKAVLGGISSARTSPQRASPQRLVAVPMQIATAYSPLAWRGNPAAPADVSSPTPPPPTRRPRSPSPVAAGACSSSMPAQLHQSSPAAAPTAWGSMTPVAAVVAAPPCTEPTLWRSGGPSAPGSVGVLVPALPPALPGAPVVTLHAAPEPLTSSVRQVSNPPQRMVSGSLPARTANGSPMLSCRSISPPSMSSGPPLVPVQEPVVAALRHLNLGLPRSGGSPTTGLYPRSESARALGLRSSMPCCSRQASPAAPRPAGQAKIGIAAGG